MKSRFALAAIVALAIMLIVTLTTSARGEQLSAPHLSTTPNYVEGEVLLKLRPGITLSAAPQSPLRSNLAALDKNLRQIKARAATAVFTEARNANLQRIYRVQIDPDQDVMAAINLLESDPNVEYAEPNYLAHAAVVPNDPLYASQWALTKINAPAAWDVVTGTPSAVIAIIDSGIDATHPDLAGRLWVNPGEIPANGIDDDNNGYVDDVNGWNFVDGNNNLADDNGHGTQVAGVAGASTNNAIGIAGMCWNCRLMIVKAMQASGVANYSDIAAAVNYAAAKGAQVINISLGGYADSATLRAAIEAASNTAVIVGGAGNDNVSTAFYPAAYSNVLAVASTTSSDTKAPFSDYGSWVDVAAPGVAISTTFSGGDYGTSEGTSLSAPLVAGLAGLIKSAHPDWSSALVRAQIVHTTDAITETQLGSGRVNAATAMLPPQPLFSIAGYTINGAPNGRPELNSGNALIVGVSNDWLDATNVVATLSESDPFVTVITSTASFGSIASSVTQSSTPFSFTVASGAGYNHPIAFTLNLSANGGTYVAALPLTITTRSGEEPVAGTIAMDTLWTNDKTYIVNGNIGIAPGVTLTIQPGTVIQFNGNYNLNVGGTLIADGTAAQPIRFESKTGARWGQIGFADSSSDASVDANYAYLSGSILRHVVIDKTAPFGIVCTSATPYLSHLMLRSGLNCAAGTLTVDAVALPNTGLLFDSRVSGSITASVSFSGDALVWRNVLAGAYPVPLTISGEASILDNTVSASVSGGAGSLVQSNVITGGITINGAGTVIENAVSKGTISVGGTLGASSVVLSNTITAGGISFSIIGTGMEISHNNIENANDWGIRGTNITGTGQLSVTHNRLVGNANGIQLGVGWGSPLVQNNLIANSNGIGLQLTIGTILSSTFVSNGGSAIQIVNSAGLPEIHGNNFEGNLGAYDIENLHTGSSNFIQAQNNWWGTTNTVTIANRIYDFGDDFNLAVVQYQPLLNAPAQDAPAYVRKVTVLPDTTLGIQTGTFEAEFSRPMDMSSEPTIWFNSTKRNTWTFYNSSNSGLPIGTIIADAIDHDNEKWFGAMVGEVARFDGTRWITYSASTFGLPSGAVEVIAIDNNNAKWVGTDTGLGRFDGTTWTNYTTQNSGLPGNTIVDIAIEDIGAMWFAVYPNYVTKYSSGVWTSYNLTNLFPVLPYQVSVGSLAIDKDGSIWVSSYGAIFHFDGIVWTAYTQLNSDLPFGGGSTIAIDQDGVKWFATNSGIVSFDGVAWKQHLGGNYISVYIDKNDVKWFGGLGSGVVRFDGQSYTNYTALPYGDVYHIAGEANGTMWFASVGVDVLHGGETYPVAENPQWLSPTRYRATYDINTLVPRDIYTITVDNAVGLDGIVIAPNSSYTFTVDYAGGIADTTPPPAPSLSVDFCANSTTSVSAQWSASDPNSAITLYRYALGSAAGGIDVLNWIDTGNTSVTRTGLNLVAGQRYYFSVKARNAGGLWSVATSRSFTAGVPCRQVYLPLVRK
jgi:subtilisin family serine protease